MPNHMKLYNTNNFIQDIRARLVAKDIRLSESDVREIYYAICDTIQHVLIEHGRWTLPGVCSLEIRRSVPRQFTVRSVQKGMQQDETPPLRTVLSRVVTIRAQLNRNLRAILFQSNELPASSAKLDRALLAMSEDDDYDE